MRKPKEHYGISTKGIKFRERWNIVEMATKEEFKEYVELEKKASGISVRDSGTGRWNASFYAKRENFRVQQRYLRKCWRLRYGNQFKEDQLYRVDKIIHRYNCKVSPREGNGVMGLWTISRMGSSNLKGLDKNSIIMYSHTDELGMHYFTRADQIDSPHQYVFKPDDHQLCAIVPLEET
tara:strand:+ start:3254 stop:3790 length:537 start_codon:yes stop_codon:yes gene_type:complete